MLTSRSHDTMHTPTVDIVVPVWNNPFETRACLAALLEHSPDARLIIVANGSSRETELMLEEFSEALGERGLFLISDRNLGLVAALNRGLARSDSDLAIIVHPMTLVSTGWLQCLLTAAEAPQAGIVTPIFHGDGMPQVTPPVKGCSQMETCSLSFSALLLQGTMRMLIGGFDEGLDGGEWCLADYRRRGEQAGYHSYVTAKVNLYCRGDQSFGFGSLQRRQQQREASSLICQQRWGTTEELCLYPGKQATPEEIEKLIEQALPAARQGNTVILLLHWQQHRECCKRGWHGVHTGIILSRLPLIGARDALKRITTTPTL